MAQGTLRRELGFLDVFAVATGTMISSGLFVLPAIAYARCGPGVVVAYVLASILVLPTVLSKAELATAMPKAGGDYFFIDRGLGAGMGTLGGISAWFSLSFKSAFALVGIGIFAQLLVPGMSYAQVKLVALAFLAVFVLINISGAKIAGRIQVVMVLVLLAILALYLVLAFPAVKTERFTPFLPGGFGALVGTAGLVFIAYGGLTKIASIAEEVRNPAKTLPLALFASWLLASVLYAGVVFVTVGVLAPDALLASRTPVSHGAQATFGTAGLVLLSVAGALAVLTTANAGILAASRSPMAMARDNLLPRIFLRLNVRFGTPHASILFTGLFMLSVVAFLDLERLVEVASALKVLLFVLVNLCVIVMRESRMGNYRPKFRAPGYPWVQIVGMVGPLCLLAKFSAVSLLMTGAFGCVALGWYFIYARPRTSRESALVYMVERLVSRRLSRGILKKELREIIRERDEIVEDRFDRLIRDSAILDLDHRITVDEFFHQISQVVAARSGQDRKLVYDLLWERERESSTVIAPGLAVPHLVLPGEKIFDIILARSREGIVFDEDSPPVHTVFVLAGTKDERNFHLKSLAAIAKIVQEEAFDQAWLHAGRTEDLRDVIILAERKRFDQAKG